jgi:SAM-dependent methyltransferase
MDLTEIPDTPGSRHPWEKARQRFFSALLKEEGLLANGRRLLDVGAGDAFFAAELARANPGLEVVCWDANYTQAALEKLRSAAPAGLRLTPDQPDGLFDGALLLDVLEHVKDDLEFLKGVVDRQIPDQGLVLVSVPAWQGLFSAHDAFLKHYRRYSSTQARDLMQAAGLTILQQGGLFHSLLFPRMLTRVREEIFGKRKQHGLGAWHAPRFITRAIDGALAVDNAASRFWARSGVDVPGLSWWALCKK